MKLIKTGVKQFCFFFSCSMHVYCSALLHFPHGTPNQARQNMQNRVIQDLDDSNEAFFMILIITAMDALFQ